MLAGSDSSWPLCRVPCIATVNIITLQYRQQAPAQMLCTVYKLSRMRCREARALRRSATNQQT